MTLIWGIKKDVSYLNYHLNGKGDTSEKRNPNPLLIRESGVLSTCKSIKWERSCSETLVILNCGSSALTNSDLPLDYYWFNLFMQVLSSNLGSNNPCSSSGGYIKLISIGMTFQMLWYKVNDCMIIEAGSSSVAADSIRLYLFSTCFISNWSAKIK